MNKGMTTCKVCGNELAKSAKRCPHCGAKNKRPIYKRWWFWLFVAIVLYLAVDIITARIEAEKSSESTENVYNSSATITLDEIDFNAVEFEETDFREMLGALTDNPLKAERFLDKFVVISGYFDNQLSEKSFSMTASVDRGNNEGWAFCELLSAEQSQIIGNLKGNENITVYGKVTQVNIDGTDENDLYYKIDIIKIEIAQQPDADEAEFIKISADSLVLAHREDAVAAENTYMNKYVEVSGKVSVIETDGFMIAPNDKNNTFEGFISCDFTDDEQKDAISKVNKGDAIVAYGKIIGMVESNGMSVLDMELIKIA